MRRGWLQPPTQAMLTASEALKRIRLGELVFEPFQMRVDETATGTKEGAPDWRLSLEWAGSAHRFAVEYRSQATPKGLTAAIAQAEAVAGSELPMVMAPYLGPDALDRLLERSVSGIDFSGNGLVIVPGQWLVLRTGSQNRYPDSKPIKAVYSGTSSLVGRVLLLRREFPQLKAIQEEIAGRGGEISLGTVSKVVRALEEDLVVVRDPAIRTVQPTQLLDRLVNGYQRPAVDREVDLRVPDVPRALHLLSARADELGVRLVVQGEDRYLVAPTSHDRVEIYVDSIQRLLDALDFEAGSAFPNLILRQTGDQRVYFDRRRTGGMPYAPPLQLYLELASGGKREREVASQLRDDLLEYRYS